jgi:hypothetical protein
LYYLDKGDKGDVLTLGQDKTSVFLLAQVCRDFIKSFQLSRSDCTRLCIISSGLRRLHLTLAAERALALGAVAPREAIPLFRHLDECGLLLVEASGLLNRSRRSLSQPCLANGVRRVVRRGLKGKLEFLWTALEAHLDAGSLLITIVLRHGDAVPLDLGLLDAGDEVLDGEILALVVLGRLLCRGVVPS